MNHYTKLIIFVIAVFSVSIEAATFSTLTIPAFNDNIRNWTDGATYNPLFPGISTFNGVPFSFSEDANHN